MSDLTDNQFYLSAEASSLYNARKYCDITFYDFGKKKIILSDEAHFDLKRYVNKQNCRIWGLENPHAYIENPHAPKTSHCLVRILVQRHNWPFFFENEEGEAVTVIGERYRSMLNEFLFTKIEEKDIGNI